jgi:hypothetical protein
MDSLDFDIPTEWMIDGVWEKGLTKQDMSCMSGAEVQSIDQGMVQLLQSSVELAKQVDNNLRQRIPGSVP